MKYIISNIKFLLLLKVTDSKQYTSYSKVLDQFNSYKWTDVQVFTNNVTTIGE